MLHRLFVIFLVMLGGMSLSAQIDTSDVYNTPYTTIFNHLYYLQSDSYIPERAALSLPRKSEELAIKLKQILDGKGLFIDLNRLPTDSMYVDSLTGEQIYFLSKVEPLIYVEKVNGQWVYSRTTEDAIPTLHHKVYPFGTQFVSYFHAPFWQVQILSIKLWKWMGLFLLCLLGWLFSMIVSRVTQAIIRNFISRKLDLNAIVEKSINRLSRIISILIGIRVFLYFIPMLQLAPLKNAFVIKGLNILCLFLFILILRSIVKIVFQFFNKAAKKTDNTLDDQLLPVVEKLVMIFIWAFGIIYILDYLDVNVTALLAGISIGGLALALAAQDTVKNFFGSIMIFLDRPFQIGDWIHFKNVDGTVEEVGIRSTRIRTFAGSLTYVPNAMLADTIVDNMGLRIYRRFKTEIGITYDTKPELIDKFVQGIREIIKMHPTTRKDYFEVHLNSFGSSSINVLIYMFFAAPSWTDELRGKHEVLYAIIKLADKLGVRFAFPTQTLHIEGMPAPGMTTTVPPQNVKESGEHLTEVLSEIEDYFGIDRENKDKFKPLGGE
ncbi:MAG: mechanosensitive ion channel family protein [Saprospiraceae bacterium]|nr:mechanosensitive ion channel family protein [Saprospiraceae bacterium]